MNPFRHSPAWPLFVLVSALPVIVLLNFVVVSSLLEAIEPYHELTARVTVRVHVVFALSLLSLVAVQLLVRCDKADFRQHIVLLSILAALSIAIVVVALTKEDLLLEGSPITFLTSLGLFLASVVAACNAIRHAWGNGWRSLLTIFWVFLSLAFFAASFDESLMVHERIGEILKERGVSLGPFHMDDVLTLSYAVGALVFAVIFIVVCFRYYIRKGASFYLVFSISVFIYGAAVILNSFDGFVRMPQGWNVDSIRLANTVKEVLEFLAASLFAVAFFLETLEAENRRFLRHCERQMQFRFLKIKGMRRVIAGVTATYLLLLAAIVIGYWPNGPRYLVGDGDENFKVEVFAGYQEGLAGVDGIEYNDDKLLIANESGKNVLQIGQDGKATILVSEADGFSSPEDVLVSPDGRIYISDDDRAGVFVMAGGKLSQVLGPADGLRKAEGLAQDAEGGLYVADEVLGAVLKLANGKLEIFVSPLDGIQTPEEIGFDRLGNLYITDDSLGKVFKVNTDGECTIFADAQQGVRQPEALAIDGDYIYITDTEVGAIFRFDLDGHGGKYVEFRSRYKNLQGLAFDEEGALYVAVSNIPPLPSVILKLKNEATSLQND